jgi:peptidoglycan hydrolase-like protein with peptidoglycan-binding domain
MTSQHTLFAFPGIERTNQAFRCGLIGVGERLGVDPNFMAAVISSESGFRPEIRNQWCLKNLDPTGQRCAVGLLQFMPFVLQAWGFTPNQVAAMSAVEQLPLVERFFRPYAPKCTSAGRTYMATFLPAYADAALAFRIGVQGDQTNKLKGTQLTLGDIYQQNAGFDKPKKGYVTVGDVVAHGNSILDKARARGTIEVSCSEASMPPKAVTEEQPSDYSSLDLPVLRLGNFGNAVSLLQRLLGEEHVNGLFSERTEKQVKAFQEKHGLKDDGVVGRLTWSCLP